MAHKLQIKEEFTKKGKKYTLPNIEGRFGFSINIGDKEIFFGVQLTDVVIEKIVRRRMLRTPRGRAKTFDID